MLQIKTKIPAPNRITAKAGTMKTENIFLLTPLFQMHVWLLWKYILVCRTNNAFCIER